MAKQPTKVNTSTLEQGPIGAGPDGEVVLVNRDDPPFKPKIVDDEGNEIADFDDSADDE
jgi:hypothetical protein